jgi:hypothetical protein
MLEFVPASTIMAVHEGKEKKTIFKDEATCRRHRKSPKSVIKTLVRRHGLDSPQNPFLDVIQSRRHVAYPSKNVFIFFCVGSHSRLLTGRRKAGGSVLLEMLLTEIAEKTSLLDICT